MEQSQAAPSLGVFNEKIWAAFIGKTGNEIYVCSSPDGLNWSNHELVNQHSNYSPALVEFDNKLWLAFTGATTNNVLVCSYDGTKWSESGLTGQTSIAGPSLRVFKNKLWVAFIAQNGSNDILICNSSDGKNWSPAVQIPGQKSPMNPFLGEFDNKLWIAYRGNADTAIWTHYSEDGEKWTYEPLSEEIASFAAPSMAILNSTQYLAITNDGTNALLVCSQPVSSAPTKWLPPTFVKGQTSQAGPALHNFKNKLVLAFVSLNTSDTLFVCSSSDGVNWSPASRIENYPLQRTWNVPDTGFGSESTNGNFTANLVLNSDGSYVFTGKYNNTGTLPFVTAPAQSYEVAFAVSANNQILTFKHDAVCQNASSDTWNVHGTNPIIAANWPAITTGLWKCRCANNTSLGAILDAVGDAVKDLVNDLEEIGEAAAEIIAICS
jgi:hypothetical protein